MNVFIVEDEALIAAMMQLDLKMNGHTVIGHATSTDQALESLKDLSPDVVMLDYDIVGGTSAPIARSLFKRQIPFVFACADPVGAIQGSGIRPNGCVAKPYAGDELAQVIEQALTSPASKISSRINRDQLNNAQDALSAG